MDYGVITSSPKNNYRGEKGSTFRPQPKTTQFLPAASNNHPQVLRALTPSQDLAMVGKLSDKSDCHGTLLNPLPTCENSLSTGQIGGLLIEINAIL